MEKITLRACRVNSGLSREDVARKLGKSVQTILKWENGKSLPDRANLAMLSHIYGVPVSFILLSEPTQNTKFNRK